MKLYDFYNEVELVQLHSIYPKFLLIVRLNNNEQWDISLLHRQEVVDRVRYTDDCYLLQFPLGLFGAVHFYLRRMSHGFIYLFSFGGLLCLWTVDMCRMATIVHEENEKITGYSDYIIKLDRLRSGFLDSLSSRPSVAIETNTRHSPSELLNKRTRYAGSNK